MIAMCLLSLQKTSILKTGGTCQIADLPGHINVSATAEEFQAKERNNHGKLITYVLKARESRFGSKRRAELVPDAQDLCNDVPLVKTNDFVVNETEFEKYNRGEVVFIDNVESSQGCLTVSYIC